MVGIEFPESQYCMKENTKKKENVLQATRFPSGINKKEGGHILGCPRKGIKNPFRGGWFRIIRCPERVPSGKKLCTEENTEKQMITWIKKRINTCSGSWCFFSFRGRTANNQSWPAAHPRTLITCYKRPPPIGLHGLAPYM